MGTVRAKVRVVRNSKGIAQFLSGPEVKADLQRRVRAIAQRAGDGMHSAVDQGRDRWYGTVWTGTGAARKAEAEGRALTRALDAGRS